MKKLVKYYRSASMRRVPPQTFCRWDSINGAGSDIISYHCSRQWFSTSVPGRIFYTDGFPLAPFFLLVLHHDCTASQPTTQSIISASLMVDPAVLLHFAANHKPTPLNQVTIYSFQGKYISELGNTVESGLVVGNKLLLAITVLSFRDRQLLYLIQSAHISVYCI